MRLHSDFISPLSIYSINRSIGWRVYTYTVHGAQPKPNWITRYTQARTQNPVYSPDGKTIAYLYVIIPSFLPPSSLYIISLTYIYLSFRAMDRPGFEADRLHIVLYDRSLSENTNLTTVSPHRFQSIYLSINRSSLPLYIHTLLLIPFCKLKLSI